MENKNKNDVLDAILAAAILGGMADDEKETKKVSEAADRAKMLREQYDAFIEVGFTEEQATQFVAAILH